MILHMYFSMVFSDNLIFFVMMRNVLTGKSKFSWAVDQESSGASHKDGQPHRLRNYSKLRTEEKQHCTSADRANRARRAEARRTQRKKALVSDQQQTKNKMDSTNAWLKHSNFLNWKPACAGTLLSFGIHQLMSNKCCSDVVYTHALSDLRHLVSPHQSSIIYAALESSLTSTSLVPTAPAKRPNVLRPVQMFWHPNTSRRCPILLVTLRSLPLPVQQAPDQWSSTSIDECSRPALSFQCQQGFLFQDFTQRQGRALQEVFHKQKTKFDVLRSTETQFWMLRESGRTVRM